MRSPAVGANEIERFRSVLRERMGLEFDWSDQSHLVDVLLQRIHSNGMRAQEYLLFLESDGYSREFPILVQELTVAETYFFRNIEQWNAFTETIVPELVRSLRPGAQLSILSAGCATGEEPYTAALALRDMPGSFAVREASILGVDINPEVLRRARRGRYSSWAFRSLSPEIQARWFSRDGKDFVLNEAVRKSVHFVENNLISDDPDLFGPERYHVIFCRNVLMYFSQAKAREVVERLTRSLVPGGYLFLGHAETLRGLSKSYQLLHTHGTFYYKRRESEDEVPHEIDGALEGIRYELEAAWPEVIQKSSERIQELAESLSSEGGTKKGRALDLGDVFLLLRDEKYDRALSLLEKLLEASGGNSREDPSVLLLSAVLSIHSGNFVSAEQSAKTLLSCDDLNSAAYYVLALCKEALGDFKGALEFNQTAIYLEPGFSMPHLHCGLILRKSRDFLVAKRELERAESLLQRESSDRILLFGGGFNREALVALCQAERKLCEGVK